jgi:hypothetical protein
VQMVPPWLPLVPLGVERMMLWFGGDAVATGGDTGPQRLNRLLCSWFYVLTDTRLILNYGM